VVEARRADQADLAVGRGGPFVPVALDGASVLARRTPPTRLVAGGPEETERRTTASQMFAHERDADRPMLAALHHAPGHAAIVAGVGADSNSK
jgi:hypothetical protein